MIEFEINRLVMIILINLPIALVLAILIHEAGHFAGGLLAGYRFTLISVLGLTLYRRFGKLHIRVDKGGPVGQCQMHPLTLKQDGTKLILGGVYANLTVGIMIMGLGIFSKNVYVLSVGLEAGVLSIILGLQNLFSDSPTNDGSTFRDARSSPINMEIYNRLMIIYLLLEDGTGPADLPDRLFEAPLLWESALSAELSLFRYMSVCEKYEHDRNGKNLISREYFKLKLYSPKTRILEAADDY